MSEINARTRQELVDAVAGRYRAGTTAEKSRILDAFVALTAYHRKHAIGVLNGSRQRATGGRRGRRRLYDEAVREALIVLWEASDRMCGKRLKPLLPVLLAALERHGHLRLDGPVREQLLAVSAATIDRLLAPPRTAAGGRRHRPHRTALRRSVPIRTFADWHDPAPRFVEADLVLHGRTSVAGSFLSTLTLTDIASGWTECIALLVRDSSLVVDALVRCRVALPFPLRGLDNGSEFLNEIVVAFCREHAIEFTRSRPYRKNDQAWVEQKNGSVVRRLVGYGRLEGVAAAATLARLYAASRLFVNIFQPSFKLAEKTRVGGQVRKRYHGPETPCARLLASEAIAAPVKDRLRALLGTLDPLRLLDEIRTVQHHPRGPGGRDGGRRPAGSRCRPCAVSQKSRAGMARRRGPPEASADDEEAPVLAHPDRSLRNHVAPGGHLAGDRAGADRPGTLRPLAPRAARGVSPWTSPDPSAPGLPQSPGSLPPPDLFPPPFRRKTG